MKCIGISINIDGTSVEAPSLLHIQYPSYLVITTSESSYNPNHPEFDNCVVIVYQDTQNYDIINKKEEDDL